MFAYLMRRLALGVVVFIVAVTSIFFLARVVAADPVRMAVGLDADQVTVDQARRELGLDRPLIEQYLRYMGDLARGDLGISIKSRQPVLNEIGRYFPATLELALVSMIAYMSISMVLGSIAGITRSRRLDSSIRFISSFTYALPTFWVGLILQIVFFAWLRWLPAVGRIAPSVDPPTQITGFYLIDSLLTLNGEAFVSSAKYLVLPVTAIVLGQMGLMARILRISILDVKHRTFVTTAHAKGLSMGRVYRSHILRNALLPVITLAGVQFGWLLTGTVIVESIFSWPGLGRYALSSILTFDYPPVLGVTIFATLGFILLNLLVDLLYRVADPRITY